MIVGADGNGFGSRRRQMDLASERGTSFRANLRRFMFLAGCIARNEEWKNLILKSMNLFSEVLVKFLCYDHVESCKLTKLILKITTRSSFGGPSSSMLGGDGEILRRKSQV